MLRRLLFIALLPACFCYQSLHISRRAGPWMSSGRPQQGHQSIKPSSLLVGAGMTTASYLATAVSPAVRPVQAATTVDPLPSNIRELLTEVKGANEPLMLRDAIKKLAEVPSLDELYFDEGARAEVNNELKTLQKENSELWAPEALYYAGIVRRAVNPYHVVELQTWLKVAPFVGGAGYMVAIFVQRNIPGLFAFAYVAAVASVVIPTGLIGLQ